MKVKFRTNLGSRDASRLGLDHTVCVVGAEVDVSDDAGEDLVASGVATSGVATTKATKKVKKSGTVKAVPEEAVKATPPPANVLGVTEVTEPEKPAKRE